MQVRLDGGQLSAMAAARASLQQRMATIRQERQSTFTAVSMALLQQSNACPPSAPASRAAALLVAMAHTTQPYI